MTPCEKLGYKAGDKFTAMRDSFGGGYRKGDVLVLREDDQSAFPFFHNETTGNTACCDLQFVRKISEAAITLRPGDYVSLREVKTDEEYDAVRDAFLAAGCPVGKSQAGMNAKERAGWKFVGWDSDAGLLNRWSVDHHPGSKRLLTIAQVLGTATVEWDGTGLPSVGSMVELHNEPGYRIEYGHEIIGKNVKVAGFVKSGSVDIAVIEFDAGMYCFRTDMLRPVRTEQQRLTDELQKAANLKPKQAERVIAAGYRKEVVK